MNTEELIEKLSQETSGKATLRSPMYYGLCLIATLLLYAIGSFFFFDVLLNDYADYEPAYISGSIECLCSHLFNVSGRPSEAFNH